MTYETILSGVEGAVATITLNRPERLNTIVPPLPEEVEAAVAAATKDAAVKVIVLRGAGRAFCAGYDFGGGFQHWAEQLETDGEWDPGKDFVGATAPRIAPTQQLMSVWRCPKPVVAQVHGWCVGGGSDFALCADLVAADVELINEAVPFSELESRVAALAGDLARIPSSQLAAMKLVVNHAYENMGLASTQTLGPILDGLMRNTPDALAFIDKAEREGVRSVIDDRDGPCGDYSQAPPELRPDPGNEIVP